MAAILALAACKKDSHQNTNNDETTTGKYLKKVNYWTVASNKEVTIRELVLDANGNITALRTYTTNAQGGSAGDVILEFNSVDKNSDGKVVKISGQDKQQDKTIEYNFTYDASGNITKSVLKQDGADYRTRNFTYDASQRLTFENELANNNNDKIVREKSYTYTATSVNPTTLVDDYKDYGVKTYTLTFDDKKNPSQAAPAFLYAMYLIDVYKANLLKTDDGTNVVNWTVTYNNDGFAASTTNGSGSGLKFVYGN